MVEADGNSSGTGAHHRSRRLLRGSVVTGMALAIAACTAGVAGAAAPTGGPPAGFPGASGTLASISGQTLEVQNSSAQTTVTYTGTTTFTQTSTATLADVTVGSCVTAVGTPVAPAKKKSTKSSSSKSTKNKKAPKKSTKSTTTTKPASNAPVDVTTVRITQPVSGACTTGFGTAAAGGRGYGPGGGFGGQRPGSGSPSSKNTKKPTGKGGFAGGAGFAGAFPGASGLVTAVNGSAITVQETNPTTKATTSKTVTATAKTTFTQVTAATSAALVVNQCITARGSADSTGAITATTISLSTPGANGCSTGFGGGRPGGFGGGGYGGGGNGPGA